MKRKNCGCGRLRMTMYWSVSNLRKAFLCIIFFFFEDDNSQINMLPSIQRGLHVLSSELLVKGQRSAFCPENKQYALYIYTLFLYVHKPMC